MLNRVLDVITTIAIFVGVVVLVLFATTIR